MSLPLFAYGTLMYPSIIGKVIGRVPEYCPGTVRGFRRLGVAGESFPGLVEDGSGEVVGFLYSGLSPREWEQLTAYESDFYVLREITVTTEAGSQSALVYLVPEKHRPLLSTDPWEPRRDLMP